MGAARGLQADRNFPAVLCGNCCTAQCNSKLFIFTLEVELVRYNDIMGLAASCGVALQPNARLIGGTL